MKPLPRLAPRSIVVSIAALVAALANPALVGCNEPEGDQFQYDADDMAAAAEGEFTGLLDGQAITLHIQRADKIQLKDERSLKRALEGGKHKRLECGNRSFVKAASACEASSSLAVNVNISSESPALSSGTLKGWFTVWGNNLSGGELMFDQAGQKVLAARFGDGVFSDWTVTTADGTQKAVDLQRVE